MSTAAKFTRAERTARDETHKALKGGASDVAFGKLLYSKAVLDRDLAESWNALNAKHRYDRPYMAKVAADPEFMRLYLAVMSAITLPGKRTAIRAFLPYAAKVEPAPYCDHRSAKGLVICSRCELLTCAVCPSPEYHGSPCKAAT